MTKYFLNFLGLLCSIILGSSYSSAQTNAQNTYVSQVDQDLAIKSILVLPTSDNLSGIYAKPAFDHLKKLINQDKQWSLLEVSNKNSDFKKSNLSTEDIKQLLQKNNTQALLTSHIAKGPKGISIEMTLYVGRNGLPLLQEQAIERPFFETSAVNSEIENVYNQLRAKLPFRGNILSRRGNEVTLNIGSVYGLKKDSRVSVVQVIKINRHPKLQFMISTEKEVLGRVKLYKVEPYMSFGYIELEKENGVIAVGAKVLPDEFVKYSPPITTASGKVLHDINTRADKEVAFGEEPMEWLPTSPPQYGKVEVLAGLGNYSTNRNLISTGSIGGDKSLVPNLLLRGEIWLDPNWYVGVQLRQSVFSYDNPVGEPKSLNASVSQYGINLGYNLLLTDDYFGPKMQIGGGYMTTNIDVDDTTPISFTRAEYGGFLLSIGGQFPLSQELPIDIGARYDFYVNPMLSEGDRSGDDSNRVNSFSFFVDYRMQTRFKIRAELMVESYNSSFSNEITATSSSHKMTTLFGGVQYLF